MPGTGNPDNYSGLAKSWILEENLQTLIYNQHRPQQQSKYLSLHAQISVVFTPQQGNVSLQKTESVTENYNQSKCSVVKSSLTVCIYNTTPMPKAQEEGSERSLRARETGSLL